MNAKQKIEMLIEAGRTKDEWPNILVNFKDLQALVRLVDEKQNKIYELVDELYWIERQYETNRESSK